MRSEAQIKFNRALADERYQRATLRTIRPRLVVPLPERETIEQWRERTGRKITKLDPVTPEQAVQRAASASRAKNPIGAARSSSKFPDSPKNTPRIRGRQ